MVDAAAPQRAAAMAAGASWLLPIAGLTLVGFSDKGASLLPAFLSPSSHELVLTAVACAVPGLALGVAAWLGSAGQPSARRRAAAGAVVSAIVLLVTGIASVAGAASGRRAQQELRLATEAAVRDFPGWNGGAAVDGARVYALEVDARSELAKILLRPYDQAFTVVLVGVDNTAGSREVVLDLDGVVAHADQGRDAQLPDSPAITREARIAHASDAHDPAVLAQVEPVHVPAGQRIDGADALFAAGTAFQDVRSISVRVDGTMRTLPGRYFTVADKRAIDQARPH